MNIRTLLTLAALSIATGSMRAEVPKFGTYAGTVRFTTSFAGVLGGFKNTYSVRAKAVFVPTNLGVYFPGGTQAGDVGILVLTIQSPTLESVSPNTAPIAGAQPAGVAYFRVTGSGEVFDSAGQIYAESPLPTVTETKFNLLTWRNYNSDSSQNSALIRLRRIGP